MTIRIIALLRISIRSPDPVTASSQEGKTRHVGKNPRYFHDPRTAQEDLLHAAPPGGFSRWLAYSLACFQPRRSWRRPFSAKAAAAESAISSITMSAFSGSNLSQATIFGLGIMPYISASIIFQLLGSVYPPLGKAAKGRRDGAKKNQRIYPLRHGFPLPGAKLVVCRLGWSSGHRTGQCPVSERRQRSGQRHAVVLAVRLRLDHDRRHGVPDVARRADRRVRHRQRHQSLDHGQYSGPPSRRNLRCRASR